jgi:hypothetical protein
MISFRPSIARSAAAGYAPARLGRARPRAARGRRAPDHFALVEQWGMPTRYGPSVSIPATGGPRSRRLPGSNPSFAAQEQNEPYTIALLIKGRSGGASTKHLYRSG